MGAQPLNTVRFSETFELLDNMLANADPDQRILTYCTGRSRTIQFVFEDHVLILSCSSFHI